jgi:hypothetical protein
MVGVKLNGPAPLHIVVLNTGLVITGFGFTVTIIVNPVPTQNVDAGPVGITVYVTLSGLLVPFVGVSVIFPLPPLPLEPDQV